MLLQLQPSTVSARVKYLLEKVRKGKHRDQDDTLNEFRTKRLVQFKEAGQRIKKKLQSLPWSKKDDTHNYRYSVL